MPGPNDKRRLKRDLMIACSLFAAGVVVSGLSLAQIRAESRMQTAQATQPLQGTPSGDQDKTPAQAKPGGDRPTTPAPEPARPDPQTQRCGDQAGTAGGARGEDRAADQGEVARRPAYCDAHLISPRQPACSIICRANDRWGLP